MSADSGVPSMVVRLSLSGSTAFTLRTECQLGGHICRRDPLTVDVEHVTAYVTEVNLPFSLPERYARWVSSKPQVNEME